MTKLLTIASESSECTVHWLSNVLCLNRGHWRTMAPDCSHAQASAYPLPVHKSIIPWAPMSQCDTDTIVTPTPYVSQLLLTTWAQCDTDTVPRYVSEQLLTTWAQCDTDTVPRYVSKQLLTTWSQCDTDTVLRYISQLLLTTWYQCDTDTVLRYVSQQLLTTWSQCDTDTVPRYVSQLLLTTWYQCDTDTVLRYVSQQLLTTWSEETARWRQTRVDDDHTWSSWHQRHTIWRRLQMDTRIPKI